MPPATPARQSVSLTTQVEQVTTSESSIIQDCLQALLFTVPTASLAQLSVFHRSDILRAVGFVVTSGGQKHWAMIQKQGGSQVVVQGGIAGRMVSGFWHVGPLFPSTHSCPNSKHGKLVATSH